MEILRFIYEWCRACEDGDEETIKAGMVRMMDITLVWMLIWIAIITFSANASPQAVPDECIGIRVVTEIDSETEATWTLVRGSRLDVRSFAHIGAVEAYDFDEFMAQFFDRNWRWESCHFRMRSWYRKHDLIVLRVSNKVTDRYYVFGRRGRRAIGFTFEMMQT